MTRESAEGGIVLAIDELEMGLLSSTFAGSNGVAIS